MTAVHPGRPVLLAAILSLFAVAAGCATGSSSEPVASAPVGATSTEPTTTTAPPQPARVLFSRTVPGQPTEVYAVLPDGSDPQLQQRQPVRTDQVSAALGRVVYAKQLSGNAARYPGCEATRCSSSTTLRLETGIVVAALDGSGEQVLTRGGYDIDPRFSPDGRTMAYLSYRGGETTQVAVIVIASPDGRIITEHTPGPTMTYQSLVWSPDGSLLATARRPASEPAETPGRSHVVTIPVGGGAPTVVANGFFHSLAWSPDQRTLAGVQLRYLSRGEWKPGDHSTGEDVWLLPLGGGPPRNLTGIAPASETSALTCGSQGSPLVGARTPMWSPDGTQVAVQTNVEHADELNGPFDVAVVNADGSGRRIVAAAPDIDCARPYEIVAIKLLGWA